ncbi:MAG: (2Fe-2S) ferredoxin domain-containing protein [Bacteroidales bacterium]|jgi:NADH:ubiquinone oxidoreductase subunit E|nr:(2Fe-2S) ferredoxin domain-containing protein [Bacteroidales bacterium]HOL97671.1 (2Fe-2S) ferredoxin domain-containing protein [Bacteroidales bacterium]HOM37255.1 (2Fe-2S) ferredoxin domain-containing protein [Bacteroidales bacterium]HPD24816.1 (2Fe-2S) ferredoxin domain-containing protein [Bacteroidales bacterium]HRT00339.1 (2Fe-2S) ferredoxin domain-containing protein [Bacteroidales bacterium]
MEKKTVVTICLGSSCFSRKNRDVVSALQEYVRINSLDEKVHLQGGHCMGKCSKGPVIMVDEQIFTEITPAKAIAIIETFLLNRD